MKRFFMAASILAVAAGFALAFGNNAAANDPSGWGTVKGRVIWGPDKVPDQMVLADVAKSQDKAHCLSKGPLFDQAWVVNKKNKGVRWVFVWLIDGTNPKADLPIHPDLKAIKQKDVVMDQPCCQFVPHALGMRQGQVLIAKNSSPIAHNYKWTGSPFKEVGGNVLLPPNAQLPIKNLPADRLPIAINCNIHSWMRGWVRVFNHPYFAVTDENGAFTLEKAPAGNYRLMVWQESAGWLGGAAGRNGRPVDIKTGGVTDTGDLKLTPN